ncbi:unnamed protein product [Linum trigynum]|uniref:Uncharacterized protein n=1 Tax=Linum trigynum TaxID=586398 RepID=A0AAV2GVT0_9ROSI
MSHHLWLLPCGERKRNIRVCHTELPLAAPASPGGGASPEGAALAAKVAWMNNRTKSKLLVIFVCYSLLWGKESMHCYLHIYCLPVPNYYVYQTISP